MVAGGSGSADAPGGGPIPDAAAAGALPPLVVAGASAGGIEALSVLVAALPAGFAAPVVVAQHLDPARPSHLGEILGRRGPLPVRTVTDQEALAPGVVYVVPADRHVEVGAGHVRVTPDGAAGPTPSIDRLLQSAAAAYGEGLIAVVLTGSGADGAAGARAVRQAGGTVIIQNPATARFPAMPRSLAPTTVDFVADLEAIGPLLHELVSGPRRIALPAEDRRLRALLEQLRERSGIDFAGYKRPTVLRRLQRRLVATDTRSLAEYQRHLQGHPEEWPRLASAFLIKVTSFFRDPDLYRHLRERVLPELLADARRRGAELRLWSAGCATGEEAYSLAILVAEALGDELDRFTVRVFATDVDAEAVAFARRGVYPAAALADVPPDLRARYLDEAGGEYTVRKRLRGLLVFGQHDLGQRAPFPRIDLALCRNVLIYFTPELQRRALQLFAFALREGGYLALGKAETATPLAEHFAVADARLKVYRRQGGPPVAIPAARIRDVAPPAGRAPAGPRPAGGWGPGAAAPPAPARPGAGLPGLPGILAGPADLLLRLPVGVVVVDRRYDIQAINAAARRLLGIHSVGVGEDLVHLARGLDPAALRQALDAALRATAPGVAHELVVEAPAASAAGGAPTLQLDAYPLSPAAGGAAGAAGPAALLLVSDVTAAVRARRAVEAELAAAREEAARAHAAAAAAAAQAEQRGRELAAANAQLLAANQELLEATEALTAENQELQVGQEEAEAAAEEVETLNEELQATNEEQETLNEELQATVEELNTTNDDLEARGQELQAAAAALEAERAQLRAVLGSMGDAVLVLDPEGRPVLTNAAYDRLFGGPDAPVTPADERGRPLPPADGFAARARRGEAYTLAFTAAGGPAARDDGAARGDGGAAGARRWFEAQGQPIRDEAGALGSVVTIRDVTERSLRRLQERFVATASHELRTPLASLTGFLQRLARDRPDAPARPAADGRRDADLALAQARRLTALVDDLLDVARLDGGGLRLAAERVDVPALAAGAVEAARPLTRGQTLYLDTAGAGTGPLAVRGDPRRLEQVLLNLLTNAIHYAPGTARIDVRVRAVPGPPPGGGPAGPDDGPGAAVDLAEIEVQDDGPGIPAAALPHLFDRFYRAAGEGDGATPGGLGLGLFIAREIVAAHGGRIDVRSAPGAGATFTVRLPALREGEPEGGADAEA